MARLTRQLLGEAGFAPAPDAPFDEALSHEWRPPAGAVVLPLANPDAGRIYPEHVIIGVIWLASVVGALYRAL